MGLVDKVVDAAIGWLVQSILGRFFTGQMQEWTREVGLAEDVENLKLEMRNVKMVLAAADGRSIDNKPLAESLDDLKEELYDAEDVMDELDYYRLQQQIEEGKGCSAAACTNPEGSCASQLVSSAMNRAVSWAMNRAVSWATRGRKRKREEEEPTHSTMLPPEIKHDILERINKIVIRLRDTVKSVPGVLQLETSRPIATSNRSQSVAWNTRLTTSVPVESKVYGRDAERDKIIEILINGKSSDLQVLSIVGIGGVGKTTLAKLVYGDQRVKDHFDLLMWVCVSTNFDEVRLTIEILDHVCKGSQEYTGKSCFNVLQETLSKHIRNKRFLLVLDDMWEYKDRSGWDELLAPLKRNQATGCMILVTTRRKSVAEMIGKRGDNKHIKVNGLHEEDFWPLFKACAFGNENYDGHPSLQSIGQQIAKALKGSPLAARSVGTLLYRNVSYEHWKTVQNKWKSLQEKDDDILPVLKLSYDYLPFHLQRCFSYCSLFPEDHQFNGEVLVRAWISQNFVQCEDTSKGLEETGRQYLNSLVDFGFFQRVGSCYAMHDLMHELAEQVSSNECVTINGLQSRTIQRSIRHLSIITTDYGEHGSFPSEIFEEIMQNIRPLQKLRTLMFFGRSSVNLLRTSSFHILCKETKSLRLLRIYVTGADIDSVCNFIKPYHLRYLEIMFVLPFGNDVDIVFPQALTRFYHLQVLDVSTWGKSTVSTGSNPTVPTGMNNLVNLRHLIARKEVLSTIPSIGKMTSLQELLEFRVQNGCDFQIKQLQSMNKLVQLGISQLGNVESKEEASQAKLIDKKHLEKLRLSWDDSGMSPEPTTEGTSDVQVLEGLRPSENLKYLHITGYSGATSPTWLDSNLSVTSLKTLHLEKCSQLKILSLEGMLSLKELKLVNMISLKELSIPSLEKMRLFQMSSLEGCISTNMVVQKEWPSSLRELTIYGCPRLVLHPLPPNANTRVSITGFSTVPIMGTSNTRGFFVQSSDTLRVLDESILAFQNLRDVTELHIVDCPNLMSISFKGFRQLVNLRKLAIIRCANLLSSYTLLEDIREDSRAEANCPLPPSLIRLKIESCGVAGMWLTKMLPHVQSLEELDLADCPQIKSISMCHPRQEEESSSLASSSECPAVAPTCLAQAEFLLYIPSNVLLTLKSFSIRRFPELQFCGSKEGFGGFVSLVELSIWGCPKLLSSADGRFSLPSSLIEFSIKHLPTKLQPYFPENQTSLTKLVVQYGPNLKSLRVQSCTALEELRISECEHLDVLEGLQFLCSLRILEIVNVGLKSLRLQSCKALEELTILRCEQLHELEGLQSCTALKGLLIWDCEHLAVLEGLRYLNSLRSLELEMNPELSAAWDRGSQERKEGSDHTRLLPPSLERLRISGLHEEIMPCLLAHLPSLSRLMVSVSPNLTSLQLGSCTALEQLEIMKCESLNSLNGLQSLRNLTHLTVIGAESLGNLTDLTVIGAPSNS